MLVEKAPSEVYISPKDTQKYFYEIVLEESKKEILITYMY